MLAPTTEGRWGEGALQAFSQASAAAWPAYAAALEEDSGLPVGLRRDGTLSVALDADDYRALEESFAVPARTGLRCRAAYRAGLPAAGAVPQPAHSRRGAERRRSSGRQQGIAGGAHTSGCSARGGAVSLRGASSPAHARRAGGRGRARRRDGPGGRQRCGRRRMALGSPRWPGAWRCRTGTSSQGPESSVSARIPPCRLSAGLFGPWRRDALSTWYPGPVAR